MNQSGIELGFYLATLDLFQMVQRHNVGKKEMGVHYEV